MLLKKIIITICLLSNNFTVNAQLTRFKKIFDLTFFEIIAWDYYSTTSGKSYCDIKERQSNFVYVVHIYSIDTKSCQVSFSCIRKVRIIQHHLKQVECFVKIDENLVLFTFANTEIKKIWMSIYKTRPLQELGYNLDGINKGVISNYAIHSVFTHVDSSKVTSTRYLDLQLVPDSLYEKLPYKIEYLK
jgi:hypothetical protein